MCHGSTGKGTTSPRWHIVAVDAAWWPPTLLVPPQRKPYRVVTEDEWILVELAEQTSGHPGATRHRSTPRTVPLNLVPLGHNRAPMSTKPLKEQRYL